MSQKSPCTKVCMMDPETGYCAGCYRSLLEIGMWTSFSDAEKEKVNTELLERKLEKETKIPPSFSKNKADF